MTDQLGEALRRAGCATPATCPICSPLGIAPDSPGDRLSRRSLGRLLSRSSALTLVAVAGGDIVGYAMLLFRKGSRAARLYSLVRSPASAGQGIGEALLVAAERAAAKRGAGEMRLEVRPDNGRAKALYERLGYAVFARIADYYEDHSGRAPHAQEPDRVPPGMSGIP